MKKDVKATAHALAVLGGAYYIICSFAALFLPDLYKSIALSWAHGMDAEKVWRQSPPDLGTMALGFITFTGAAWVTGYAFAWVYNYFVGKK
ncbi:hypothetical protein A2773_06995 [Candidatus Gottesmanbacteria bacterium RIFCSPHIGHO2_01_FULL_39_10]|uniref:Uncharacterized protein n=1 Tax=Candidatus Gottesmanbacteria bacterium RIFCSPHIGHO2_01_FULL_39_10 TaxID=1798375 RepID=A0A1F5ZQT6_9BACT|nr:MAG: hypothetical protein A2773_06995 [Candidatus Gottesmanbacteria bacterium RIFCSPHIGHO2_01_FULL_39_10]